MGPLITHSAPPPWQAKVVGMGRPYLTRHGTYVVVQRLADFHTFKDGIDAAGTAALGVRFERVYHGIPSEHDSEIG